MKKYVTLTFIFIALGITSCIQTENSSSQDRQRYGDIGGSGSFLAVRQILIDKCITCHADFGNDEDYFVSSGYVIAADSVDSPLYYRLTNSDGFGGPKNMPESMPALSNEDLSTIKTWIDAL